MDKYKNKYIKSQVDRHPKVRKDVLSFIYDIDNKSTQYDSNIKEKIYFFRTPAEIMFADGYCYYFALILKDAFGGSIMWHKNHGHIVWMDENKICYDIYGVFDDYGEGDIVPISELGEKLIYFKHI